MKYRIEESGINGNTGGSEVLKIALNESDGFKSRSSCVISYGGDVETSTETTRSLWKAVTSFENFPITRIKAIEDRNGGVLTIAPPYPGSISAIEPDGRVLKVQSLAFLGVPYHYSVDLIRNEMYRNDSLATLKVEKTSDKEVNKVFVGGFGGTIKLELDEGEKTHISEDHLLAMDATVSFKRNSRSNLKETAFDIHSTPTLDVIGPGTVYMHSRSPFKFNRVIEKLEEY
jgi:uncharacterized protein (AIM24 family)